MTRGQKIKKFFITLLITAVCTAAVLWLRTGGELAVTLSRIEVSGIVFSTSDLFVIIGAGLCGYRYGILMFLAIFGAEAISGSYASAGLFQLSIYFIVAVLAGYFSEKRIFKSVIKTIIAGIIFCIVLSASWYIIFTQLYSTATVYTGANPINLMIGAVPESFTGVFSVYLLFKFIPDRIKKYVGKGWLYTREYEQSDEMLDVYKSKLGRYITLMSVIEATALSVIAIVFSNAQLRSLSDRSFFGASELRTIVLSDDQYSELSDSGNSSLVENKTVVGGESDVSAVGTDSSENADEQSEAGSESLQPALPPDDRMARRELSLSDDQLTQIADEFIPQGHTLTIMNVQLLIVVMSISLPLALIFNEVILKSVVRPIKRLSAAMSGFFSEDENQRREELDKIAALKIRANNEIGQLSESMHHMLNDMSEYINAVQKQKQLEAELKIAEARSDAKSSFLSNMSHEIRTPINAVLGLNEMILRESTEEPIIEYAENIRTAGNTLLGLINDILDFSKIEAGKMDIIPVDYDLASVLNDLVNMIESRASAKGLSLTVNVNPGTPNFLHGDEIRIKQIATNILTNAVKYTEKGGVSMTVEYEEIPQESDSIGLKFTVSDTGIGIKPEDMEKLFKAFERIEEERNRTVEGTGLGMNITQSLLAMMGSKLDVQSEYGKGSSFSFTVKQQVVRREAIGDFETALKRSIAERKRYKEKFVAPDALVLVVDDTPMNLTVFVNLLKKTKIGIETARSGDECIKLCKEKKYDIVFLDHMMPEKDGIQTLAELKALENNPNAQTPVICLTANAVSGARERYIEAGFRDYITKPINPDNLETMIIEYLPEEKLRPADSAGAPQEEKPTGGGIVPEWLYSIGEIDVKKGIQHCGGEKMYLETIAVYAQAVEENTAEIEKYLSAEDWRDVTVKVHALKSTSRVIGAADIGEEAQRLENAGNDNDISTLKEGIGALLERYRALGEALSPLVPDEAEEENLPEISPEELSDAYATINELSQMFDYDSVQYVMDSLRSYRMPEGERERYKELKKAVSKPDWDKIAQLTRI